MRQKIYKTALRSLLACMVVLGFICCEDVNNWSVDDSYNRTFTPVTFKMSERGAYSVQVTFTPVQLCSGYVIEVHQDSLKFENLVKTLELTTEDAVLDETETSEVYLYTVDGLEAATRYSLRMKAKSSVGAPDSNWAEFTFNTTGEQIINPITEISSSSALITWTAGADVSRLFYNKTSDQMPTVIDLSATEIASGECLLEGLESNTEYTVRVGYVYSIESGTPIYRLRGERTFKTQAEISGDGERIFLTGGEDLNDLIAEKAAQYPQMVFVFPEGSEYLMGTTWTIPDNVTSLTLWGLPGEKPVLELSEMKLGSNPEFKLWVYNMDVKAQTSSHYLLNDNPSTPRTISEIKFEESNFSNGRTIFRFRGSIAIGTVEITNSTIYDIADYGLFCFESEAGSMDNLIVKNSTFYNFGTGNFMQFRIPLKNIDFTNCTFFNIIAQTGRNIFDFRNVATNIPARLSFTNCIFASNLEGITMRGGNPKIESQFMFNSYKTNDFLMESSNPFTGIKDYNKPSTTLFADPENGDFTIMDESIDYDTPVGDLRWWK